MAQQEALESGNAAIGASETIITAMSDSNEAVLTLLGSTNLLA
jgi:hypothetical protein